MGVWNPLQVHAVISSLAGRRGPIAIGFHGHNDLGMATANTLAAVAAGARSVDVTVNGLGERAGNAPLEELAMALQVSCRRPSGIDTRALTELSRLVARASGRPVAVSKPVVGQHVFHHESGIHVRGMLDDRRTYEPFLPERVGAGPSRIVLGKHSGTAAVRHVLNQRGFTPTPDEIQELLASLRSRAATGSASSRAALASAAVPVG